MLHRATACLAIALAVTPFARAQEGGLTTEFGFTQSLRYDDNPDFVADPDEGSFISRTDLSFNLASRTRSQSLRFGLSGSLRNDFNDDEEDFEFERPTARLNYSIRNASTRLRANASYRRDEVERSFFRLIDDPGFDDNGDGEPDPDPDPLPDDDLVDDRELIVDQGTRETLNYGVRFETGLNAPFGTSLRLRQREVDYTDTEDPDLFDSSRTRVDARLRFRIDPTIRARLTARWIYFEADDERETERETVAIGVGTTIDVTPRLRFTADLSADRIETERTTGDETDDGASASVGLVRDMPNGTISTRFSSDLTRNGQRNSLRFGRSLSLPNGSLSFNLGVTRTEDGDTNPLADLELTRDVRGGALNVSLSQNANVNDDDEDVINTRLSVGFNRQINAVSSWNASLALADTNVLQDDGDDRTRANFQVSYRREIVADWNLATGYEYAVSNRENQDDRTSNVVFLNLERQFNFRP